MMQTDRKWPHFAASLLLVAAVLVPQTCLRAADRTTLLIPLEHDAKTGELPDGVFGGAFWRPFFQNTPQIFDYIMIWGLRRPIR